MKKILIAAFIILLILLIFFLWLISIKKKSPETTFSNGSVGKSSQPISRVPTFHAQTKPTLSVNSFSDRLKLLSPYDSKDFSVAYSPSLNKFIITKKTANADAEIAKWAQSNSISELIEALKGNDKYSSLLLIENPGVNNSKNPAIEQLPQSQKLALENIKSNLPNTDSFQVRYSPRLDTYIVQIKNDNGSEDVTTWAQNNNVGDLVTNSSIFVYTKQPIDIYEKTIVADISSPKAVVTITPIIAQSLSLMQNLFSFLPTQSPTAAPQNNLANTQTGTTVDTAILATIQSYGLPPPIAEGSNGYTALKEHIISNSNALWATQQLLEAEKKLGVQNHYLPTTWLWSEFGASGWPDPYLVNCHDNTNTSLKHSITEFCPGGEDLRKGDKNALLQIAGFQAQDRALFNQIVPTYQKVASIYGYTDIKTALQGVYDNSDKASISDWSYKSQASRGMVQSYINNGQVPSAVSLNDIATSKTSLYSNANPKIQFYTALLGKNPAMATALNAIELDGDGFISLLKSGNCLYQKINGKTILDTDPGCLYYNHSWKQTLSNMIAALYLIDTGASSLPPAAQTNSQVVAPPSNSPFSKANCPPNSELIQAPGTISRHLQWRDICIKPTMIVIHWTGSWTSAQVTEETLNQRQLGCQFETDESEMIQALNIYQGNVERAACVLDYNNFTINNEISGTDFDSVYKSPGNSHYNDLMSSTAKAISSTCWQMKQYGISVDQVYGHLELNPGRKQDPGTQYINYFRDRLRKECT